MAPQYLIAACTIFALGVLLGSVSHKPPFLISAFAILAMATISIAQFMFRSDSSASTSVTNEMLFFTSQITLAVGLFYVVRIRLGSRYRNVIADGTIVAIGAWLISWVVLIRPSIATSTATTLTVSRGLTLGASIVVVFLLTLLAFSDRSPSPSAGMMSLSVTLTLTTVILRAISIRGDISLSQTTIETPLVMGFAIAGAAFMHQSSRTVTHSGVTRISPPLTVRLLTTTVSLIVPIVIVALTDPDSTQDRVVRTVSVSVLAIAAMVRIIQSVRTNARTQEQLLRNALTDSLTGLPNRIMMLQHIDEALQNNWNSTKQTTVLFIDVDRFKNINDSLGHSIGDNVLTDVAQRLVNAVSPTSTVGRIAGDEFVVVDSSTESPTQSVLLAERVLDAFREPMRSPEGDMFITASVGVAYASRGVQLSADDLMRHADTAMYRAKAAGRNCIALFDESMLDQVTKRLEVETALYRALERNELRLVHQPIIDIELGIVVGFEALMRWDRSDGPVSPADFIPIAEETGTIVPLGSWALNDALQQLRTWIVEGVCSPETTMSVNVSPRQLHDPQFFTVVKDALQNAGIPPEQLWLEVTESVVITEPAQTLTSLKRLNSLGVRIAIDDFGTGYSSLSLLQQFPIQCIKIDRSFVQRLESETSSQNLVRTIIAMASAMGADIVAEGIEDAAQLRILSLLNCRRAQGFHISRPLDPNDIPTKIAELQNLENWKSRLQQ